MPPSPSLRVGPSGWRYPEWEGVVYPTPRTRATHPLEYLARHFDLVEIESTFERPLRPEVARLWLAKVSANPALQFTAVLGRHFTHERSLDPDEVARFQEGLRPLLLAGRLGCLLLQFPWAFRFTVENREFLIALRRAFHEFPMAVEMRHASWLAEEALGTLIDYRLGYVCIDQPEHARAMPPTAVATSSIGYVRLHGRNPDYWSGEFGRGAAGSSYLYSPAELEAWAARIRHVAAHTQTTFVVLTNANGGKSVVNALQLAGLLEGAGSTPRRAVA